MKIHCSHDKLVRISDLKPHPKNRNKHPQEQITRLAEILNYQGWRYPVKVSKLSGYVTSGHGRIEAAKLNKWTEVPVNFQDYDDEEQEYADLQADNAIALWAEMDLSSIHTDLEQLDGLKMNIDLLGIKDFRFEPDPSNLSEYGDGAALNLQERFGVPPFSILDTRQGYWVARKRQWLAIGIQSELGRGGGGGCMNDHQWMKDNLKTFQASKVYLKR